MAANKLYIELFALAADQKPMVPLERRVIKFLEGRSSTESLDSAVFNQVNGSKAKADYLLGDRLIVAELKTLNASPKDRTEQRLNERFSKPDAPIVYGTVDVSQATKDLPDRDAISKMIVDMAGRAVRRHLLKANDQIGAIKARLGLPNAGGILILMNDAEAMIDASAIGYTLKNAFETNQGRYPHITNVWAIIESHRIALPGGRVGFPHLHVFKSLERQAELNYIGRMLWDWGCFNESRMERVDHRGDWNVMMPVHEGDPLTFQTFKNRTFDL